MESKNEAICGRDYHAAARIVTAGFVRDGNRRSSASRRETVRISEQREGDERLPAELRLSIVYRKVGGGSHFLRMDKGAVRQAEGGPPLCLPSHSASQTRVAPTFSIGGPVASQPTGQQ